MYFVSKQAKERFDSLKPIEGVGPLMSAYILANVDDLWRERELVFDFEAYRFHGKPLPEDVYICSSAKIMSSYARELYDGSTGNGVSIGNVASFGPELTKVLITAIGLRNNLTMTTGSTGRKPKELPVPLEMIRMLQDSGQTLEQIAETYDMSRSTLCRILRNNREESQNNE